MVYANPSAKKTSLMPVIILHLQDSGSQPTPRPEKCPYCSCLVLQSWGQATPLVQDVGEPSYEVNRYRCTGCKRTFRHYPDGFDRSVNSQRLRKMAALVWIMGLSSRDVVDVFGELGVELSRMTVWREGRELARHLEGHEDHQTARKYALDRLYVPGISSRFGVVVVIDSGQGKRVVLGILDEYDPRPVKSWLEYLVRDSGVRVAIASTDFLSPAVKRTGELVATIP
jgi:hypothetical protein